MTCALQINQVSAVFNTQNGPYHALENIHLEIETGQFVCLVGHSGCGKSTLLNLVAGLTMPTSGELICEGVPITAPGPDRGMVFQHHSLLPWLTCFDNILLGVRRVFGAKEDKAALRQRTEKALALVQLEHAKNKYPYEISGGMKQRVGIARALAIEPNVLLMDEPFGALDELTRASLQDELMRIATETNSTVLMVTHNIDEAILLSDRILMMTNGPAAHIGEDLKIDLARPRDRLALLNDAQYADYRRQLMEFLYLKQKK